MILFKYTKTDGAEFLSHLDILRHIGRTTRRAGIKVALSQGFNPHMLVYLSAPMGVGIQSLAEYCQIETDEEPTSFIEKFNKNAPRGLNIPPTTPDILSTFDSFSLQHSYSPAFSQSHFVAHGRYSVLAPLSPANCFFVAAFSSRLTLTIPPQKFFLTFRFSFVFLRCHSPRLLNRSGGGRWW